MAIRNKSQYARRIRNHEDFKIGNVSGHRLVQYHMPQTGNLPLNECEKLKAAVERNDLYMVCSYATPIGWLELTTDNIVDSATEEKAWYIPDTKYSVTTTQHQSLLKISILRNSPY